MNQVVNFYDSKDIEELKAIIQYNKKNKSKSVLPSDEYMTISQVSVYLGVTQATVRRYTKLGFLTALGRLEVDPHKPTIFDRIAIEQFKASKQFVKVTGKKNGGRIAFPPKLDRKKEDEIHPTGCIIHWGEFFRDENSYSWVPITCAACKTKFLKRESGMRQAIKKGEFTGCCIDCYQANRHPPKPRNDGKIERSGYIYCHKRLFSENEWFILGQMNPNNGLYIPEHRVVMALYLGRVLNREEAVHHIDGNPKNNDISNLSLYSMAKHAQLHARQLRRESNLKKEVEKLKIEVKQLKTLLNLYQIPY